VTDRKRDDIQRAELLEKAEQTFFAIGLAATGAMAAARGSAVEKDAVPPSLSALSTVAELASTGAQELREAFVADLPAARLARCAGPSVVDVFREFSRRTGRQVDLVLSGPDQPLEPHVVLALCAAAAEALSEVARLSRADALLVGVHTDSGRVSLCVQDDAGVGTRVEIPRKP
jgi:signal transduction histidine kinase